MGLNCKSVSGEDDLDGWDQNANFEQPKPVIKRQQQQQEQKIEKLKCPRCDSANTKFCYYNNYNKEQPRHFCKTCKRYWTKGGTLRNVPEGGGRKNKRPRISNSPTRSSNPINSVFNPANESINQKSEPHSFPFSYDDPKTLVPIDPYKDLIPSSLKSGSIFLGSSSSTTTKNIYPNFLSSSFSFDGNPYSVSSSSFQQSNSAYNYIGGNEATEDSMAMTSSNNIVDQSLNVPVPTGCAMEMQSWWNWDDIDALVSADNNAPWIKDSEINS